MSLRESYDLPKGPGLAGRMWIVMAGVAGVALLLWLVLPASAVTVAVTAVALLVIVGTGVGSAMSSRQAQDPPGHNPEPTPREQHRGA